MTDVFTKRKISHGEASDAARRLIDGFFNNPGKERPRASIPARPDYDDDLVLLSYIKQQESSTPPPSPNELLEAAKEFAEAAAKEFNEKGAGGFALARLTDLRTAIRNAEQTGAGKRARSLIPESNNGEAGK